MSSRGSEVGKLPRCPSSRLRPLIDIDFTGAPVSSAELAPCAVTTPRLRSLRPPHLSDLKLQAPAWLPACGIDLAAPLRSNG
jgi:hypothetical protein